MPASLKQKTSFKKATRFFFLSFFVIVLSFVAISTTDKNKVVYGQVSDALDQKYTGNQDKLEEHAAAIEDADKGGSNIDATTGNAMMSLQAAATFMLGGPEAGGTTSQNPELRKALANKYGGGVINHINDGIIAMFSNPAANTQTYVADIMRSAKIIPPAQAQGLGFASLDPILETWKMFRNVAYLFFVVMFLIIGFMIMFRQKIGGQTVVTAQQAIPSIITSLIFVTFSYAIAGFMIDLMYLVMFLIIGLFGASTSLIDKSFLQLGLSLLTGEEFNDGIYSTVSGAVADLARNVGIPDAIGWIGGVTIGLIFIVAMVIGIFKLFFELLKTYVTIIASIAFAPLFLMVGAIPGKNVFKGWLQQLIGNLMAFPVTLMLLVMYNKMTEANIGQGGFMPPYLIGQGQGGAITVLVGLGIILVMPEVVKKAKEAMGVKDSVFTQLAKDAATNAKKAWSGEGIPMKMGAKNLMKGGALVGGTVASAGAGSLIGGAISKSRGGSFASGAKTGALYGSVVPAGLAVTPSLAKEGYNVIKSEAGQMAAEETIGALLGKVSKGESKLAQKAAEIRAKHYSRTAKNPRRNNAHDSAASSSGGDLGSGNA